MKDWDEEEGGMEDGDGGVGWGGLEDVGRGWDVGMGWDGGMGRGTGMQKEAG